MPREGKSLYVFRVPPQLANVIFCHHLLMYENAALNVQTFKALKACAFPPRPMPEAIYNHVSSIMKKSQSVHNEPCRVGCHDD